MADTNRDESRAAEAPRVVDCFGLPTEAFRGTSGRLDAARIAEAAGLPLHQLAAGVGVEYATLRNTPDTPAVQAALLPYANILAMLQDLYAEDRQRLRAWLQAPRAELGNRAPRDAMLEPGGARGVEQFVTGAWLGDRD